ncbi:MAG: hypothetical protein CFE24_14725 [Flavobacterium sp. BFFFF2]|nr:MAG: hypothetical protein CFE24_14725 [Flavobacterium sp. BFFFF2]
MDQLTSQWVEATKTAINSLQGKYKVNRGMLLTEGDLECHFFSELLQQSCLFGFYPSKDNKFHHRGLNGFDLKTTYVHSQVTWFKPDQKSGFEVDITICDPLKLEVVNIELFEEYTSKGFAYDGECVAIEVKFIRDMQKASQYGHEDYLKLRDKLIPAKLENIRTEKYKISTSDNIAFIAIIGCKNKEIFETARFYLGKHLSDETKPCPENLFVCIFYQDRIIWDKEVLKRDYLAKAEEPKNNTNVK